MKAIRFKFNPVRYGLALGLGAVSSRAFTGKAGLIAYEDVPEPDLPGDEWVKIDTKLGGICGSDLSLITLRNSPSLSTFASFPSVIGHENVGIIREVGAKAGDLQPGRRVIVDPLLSCVTRGFGQDPCPFCRQGMPNRCLRFTEGDLAPGLLMGNCRDTGGSWGETFVAHRAHVFPVPDNVSDANALLAEPFACALHAVNSTAARTAAPSGGTALVIGGGVIGLSVVAALRILAPETRIVALVRYSFQEEMARRLGADEVLRSKGRRLHRDVARELGASLLKPVIGPPVLVGGADVVYECAGSAGALADSLRFAAPGGRVVLLGLASLPRGIDWSHVWRKELDIQGVFAAAPVETDRGPVPAMALALQLFATGKVDLTPLLTHRFPLGDYRQALAAAMEKRGSGCIKAAFEF